MHDLAATHLDIAADLQAKWEAYAKRARVLPWIWKPPYGEDPREGFSKQTLFELKPGDALPRDKAPYVKGKPFTITVELDKAEGNGVLVAQGGSSQGYSLYVAEGKLTFAVRRGGKLATVTAEEPLPLDAKTITAGLARKGKVTLSVDGRMAASGKVPGTLVDMPLDGLEVGRDEAGAVAPYEVPDAYPGQIHSVRIELGE
jgi:arylsulfatase